MNENRIISWEEAERILMDTSSAPVKSSLPEQVRPTEPDNDTDVDQCIQKLLDNDPHLKEINLNNMKRTPIPQIRRLLEAMAYNEHCERLSLANMGLYDNDIAVLLTVIEMNTALRKLNLETNYLSGDFFAKLFRAALV
uniref:Tropomodulin n=1 Tax=Angiostrongylus cantonensis TaxID=6313 RepID=A0A0K0DLP2_ANGCA